ncbi:hypothetical protein JTB14_032639 [Gonioctena quinquepunctata]|nr:hypothetical protein JTB14_032639 [Gonioctena quinquepunctata]
MKNYLDSYFMEPTADPSPYENNYYIPHHCVFNPNSPTTKLRVVFEASAKSPSGLSLNDNLLTGRKLQQDLVALLLRFRLHKFVFTADIKGTFPQILIEESHRDFQRLLWRFSIDDHVQDFRLTHVSFGICASPYLSLNVLTQLAADEKNDFPLASQILVRDIHEDDIYSGGRSLEETKYLQDELIAILKRGCFHLRKWSSNNPEFFRGFPPEDCQQTKLNFHSDDPLLYQVSSASYPFFKKYQVSSRILPLTIFLMKSKEYLILWFFVSLVIFQEIFNPIPSEFGM